MTGYLSLCRCFKLPFLVALSILLAAAMTQVSAQSRICRDPTPARNLNEMFDAIYACWVPPEDTEGLVVTLRFILHKDGQIREKWSSLPRVRRKRARDDRPLSNPPSMR